MEGVAMGVAQSDELPKKHQGVLLTFQGVGYSLPKKGKKEGLHILDDVTGYFAPGTVTATMGPSGAGKTTFLDVVTGRKTKGTISGSLLYDGHQATKRYLQDNAAYVEQFDNLLAVLTVREMLMYQAELKCSVTEPRSSKQKRVEKLIEDLGLQGASDVRIGDKARPGISGGQAKRVNIGIALVTEPRIIFLDEPTTGLDSATSVDVCTILKDLARSGVTIMTTIHSPTTEAFRLFDNLLLLVRGRTCYFGKLHGPDGVADYLSTLHIFYDPLQNLADFIIKETGDKVEDVDFACAWAKSSGSSAAAERCKTMLHDQQKKANSELFVLQTKDFKRHQSFGALGVLMRYRTRANFKDVDFLQPRLLGSSVNALIIASLYAGVGEKAVNYHDTANRSNVAALFFMAVFASTAVAFDYMPSIVQDRPLFYRETADGCYTTIAYVLYKLIEEAIPQLFSSLFFCGVTHLVIKFQGSFMWYWVLYNLTSQAGLAMSYCCAALGRTIDEATTIMSVYLVVSIFFTGFLFTYDALPAGWQWYTWTNFARFAWSGMVANEFGEECEIEQDLAAGRVTLDEYSTYLSSPSCPIEYFGIDSGSAGAEAYLNFFVLAGFWLLWVCLTWFIMGRVRHVQR